ncbi:MAG: hypothetical protein WC651_03830 [Candidatus Gracilibacteria bacterium]|jgi:hypothetical protein
MKNKILQKSIISLVIAFLTVGGIGTLSQSAYAAPAETTPAATTPTATTPTQSVKESCEALNLTPKAEYIPVNNTCFIPNGKDCTALGAAYEEIASSDQAGISCKKVASVSATNPEQEKVLRERIYFIIEVQKWLNSIIWPILVMTGDLMNNNILFGAGMDERLREVWIPIRNLMNLFFVLAMVAIAIYNILGIGDDNDTYSIKQILPKMIIAIIAVNFSFIGIKVFLDGINVLTSSIFALPDQAKEGLGDISQNPDMIQRFCLGTMGRTVSDMGTMEATTTTESGLDLATYKKVILDFATKNKITAITQDKLNQLTTETAVYDYLYKLPSSDFSQIQRNQLGNLVSQATSGLICTNDFKLTLRGKAFLTKYNSQNAALAMALNMSQMVFYKELDITTLTEANVSKLLTNTVFSVAMYLIYVVSFLALFIVLLARLVVMWVGIVASPIIIVSMVLPVFKEKLGFGDLVDKFVQNAIAPIMIAFSMAVGWIMLRAIQSVNILSSDSITIGSGGIPVAGLNTIQDLIVAVGTLGVIWMAVSAASNKSIAEPVTKALYGGLGKAGSFIGDVAWRNMPLFPVTIPGQPDNKMQMTPEIIGQVLRDAKNKYEDTQSNKAKEVSEALGLRNPNEKRFSDLKEAKNSKEALGIMRRNEQTLRDGGKEADGNLTDFLGRENDNNFQRDLTEKKMGPKSEDFKKLIDSFKTETDPEKRKKSRVEIADYVRKYGEEMEGEWEKRKTAGTEPKATPAPYAFTEDTKVGNKEIGKEHIDAMNTATKELTAALKEGKDLTALKPLLEKFKVDGQSVTDDQLKKFITDPDARKKLEEIFGGKKLAEILSNKTPAPAQPATSTSQATQPVTQPTEAQRTAQLSPQPPQGPNEQPKNENPPGPQTGIV